MAKKLRENIDEILDRVGGADKKEFKVSHSELFFGWQGIHGPDSLPGGLLRALKFDSWDSFLRCCFPLLQPLRSPDEGNIASVYWARGFPGQGDDHHSFSRDRSGDHCWRFDNVSRHTPAKRPAPPDDDPVDVGSSTPTTITKTTSKRSAEALAAIEAASFARRSL